MLDAKRELVRTAGSRRMMRHDSVYHHQLPSRNSKVYYRLDGAISAILTPCQEEMSKR